MATGNRPPGRPKGTPKTGGRQKGTPNKVTSDVRQFCLGVLADEDYRENLKKRARAGDLAPAVECMLWHYAHGRPKEQVEVSGAGGGPIMLAWADSES